MIYLDNNATSRVAPEVLDAMLPYLETLYGNPSSMHSFGGKAQKAVKLAREQVATSLGAQPEEILFTSCGSESDSTAIFSALQAQPDKKHLVSSRVEHPAVLNVMQYLESQGYHITLLEVDSKGQLDLNALRDAVRPDTALVSLMAANNETGVLFPIAEAAAFCREQEIPFHTDAVQAVGKIPLDMQTLPADYLSLSGHKLHAPKGIGALYIRRGTRFKPFLRGGHQEFGRRAGTENVPYIVALGTACELAMRHMEAEQIQVRRLRDQLENGILSAIPDAMINGDPQNRLPNTTSIAFKNVEGEAILLLLDQYEICASSGSACTSGSLEPSHVLRAMGVPFHYAHGSIRFSLSRYTTENEIRQVLEQLPPIIKKLREMSPFKG